MTNNWSILTIFPDLFLSIFLIANLLIKKVEVRFIFITFCHSSKLILIARLSWVIPALLTIPSKLPPSSFVAFSINSSILSLWEISNFNIFKPSKFFFNSSSFSILVPEAKIFAPASLSFFIIALPIPPYAPVTMMFFFSKLLIFLNLQYLPDCWLYLFLPLC